MAVPAGALRLTLAGSGSGSGGPACLRPARSFAGAQVLAERAGGALGLLLAEGLGPAGGGRVASFRFRVHADRYPEPPPQAHGLGADGEWWAGCGCACRPHCC